MGTPWWGTPAYYKKLARTQKARAKKREAALARNAAVVQLLRKRARDWRARLKAAEADADNKTKRANRHYRENDQLKKAGPHAKGTCVLDTV